MFQPMINDFGINPIYCVSIPGYTSECDLKHTNVQFQIFRDKDMIL